MCTIYTKISIINCKRNFMQIEPHIILQRESWMRKWLKSFPTNFPALGLFAISALCNVIFYAQRSFALILCLSWKASFCLLWFSVEQDTLLSSSFLFCCLILCLRLWLAQLPVWNLWLTRRKWAANLGLSP